MEAGEHLEAAWEALDSEESEIAATHARRALTLAPDEIDAYALLAEIAATAAEKQALLREAVRIGTQEWSACFKKPSETSFWLSLGTRPYMRAVHSLAIALWDTRAPDKRLEAVAFARHLLRLNPNDNQGIRFLLLAWLPIVGQWDAAAKIARRFARDGRTETTYWHALHLLRAEEPQAVEALKEALAINPHVPSLLTSRRKPAMPDVDAVAFRSPNEARAYAHMAHEAWRATPKAVAWLKTLAAR
ncbi:MAG: hypothetical protein K2Y20_09155 [Sphingomonas sp.]|nr:hypothetical protein [Sphingomonas sp.]